MGGNHRPKHRGQWSPQPIPEPEIRTIAPKTMSAYASPSVEYASRRNAFNDSSLRYDRERRCGMQRTPRQHEYQRQHDRGHDRPRDSVGVHPAASRTRRRRAARCRAPRPGRRSRGGPVARPRWRRAPSARAGGSSPTRGARRRTQPRAIEVGRLEHRGDAAIGGHRPLALRVAHGHDHAAAAVHDGPADLDAAGGELGGGQLLRHRRCRARRSAGSSRPGRSPTLPRWRPGHPRRGGSPRACRRLGPAVARAARRRRG